MKHLKRIILGFTLCSSVLSAGIINVPADVDSIQGGINLANQGDTVLVQPGTYLENINFTGKNIVVGSLTLTTGDTVYISQTVIDGDSSGSVVIFENGEDSTTVLYGFTVTNGRSPTGGGIYIQDSSPRLSHLIVKNNIAHLTLTHWDAYGGGIYCEGSNSILENVTVKDNKAVGGQSNRGNGIYFINSNPTLVNVEVEGNTIEGSAMGGGIYCEDSDPFFSNMTVVGNSASGGGGIMFEGNCNPIFDPVNRCNIYFNEANVGRDLRIINDSLYIEIVVDTFTVMQPDDYFVYPENNFTSDILNAKVEQVNSDLYVNPNGDNSNSGLSPMEPLKTISFALMRIMADSLEPHSIYLADGIYSPSISGEIYPLNMRNYVSLHGESESGVILDADNPNLATIIFILNHAITLEYLTITGGLDGINCHNSCPNIKNVTVTNNGGNGIITFTWYSNAEPFLYNVTISKNSGDGIHCRFSRPNLSNLTIADNSGYGIKCSAKGISIVNTIIME